MLNLFSAICMFYNSAFEQGNLDLRRYINASIIIIIIIIIIISIIIIGSHADYGIQHK